MRDVISSIGIGIGTAVADSIGYRAPARYRFNPTTSIIHRCLDMSNTQSADRLWPPGGNTAQQLVTTEKRWQTNQTQVA